MNNRSQWLRHNWRWVILLLVLMIMGGVIWMSASRKPAQTVRASVTGLPAVAASSPALNDYQMATGPGEIVFPRDFGPHPSYLTEWWYYTGNLSTADGRRFGFQLTFFRRAVTSLKDVPLRSSDLATNQVYLAHFTLSDITGKRFHYFEHFERGAAGLAGAQITPMFQVWLHNWSVQQTNINTYHLTAQEQGVALDLNLVDNKGPILEGDQGYSQKGPQPGNASLYFSQTRLSSQGKVVLDGNTYMVSGSSWMDREISTSALGKGLVGWDWFALQLNDGTELMAYVLRRSDGSIDAFSQATFIQTDGETVRLKKDDFQVLVQSTWRSPHSGANYPSHWKVHVPSLKLDLSIQPLLSDQELNVSFTYWEGAVAFDGARDGKAISGQGYVELTGYAQSMEGTL